METNDSAGWTPELLERALGLLGETKEEKDRRERKKRREDLKRYEKRKDAYGHWLRTGKRKTSMPSTRFSVRLPAPLADKILVEAEDVKYPPARLIAVLTQLGLPLWYQYRQELTMERDPEHAPPIVKAIVEASIGPKKASYLSLHWKRQVEANLQAQAEVMEKNRSRRKKDPTTIFLESIQ